MKLTRKALKEIIREVITETDGYPNMVRKNKEVSHNWATHVAWKSSTHAKKYGKLIQNKNWDTDGHVGKIFYTNYSPKYKFKTRELWQFTAARQFKRAVAKFYPSNWKKFVTMKTKIRVTDMYKKKKE